MPSTPSSPATEARTAPPPGRGPPAPSRRGSADGPPTRRRRASTAGSAPAAPRAALRVGRHRPRAPPRRRAGRTSARLVPRTGRRSGRPTVCGSRRRARGSAAAVGRYRPGRNGRRGCDRAQRERRTAWEPLGLLEHGAAGVPARKGRCAAVQGQHAMTGRSGPTASARARSAGHSQLLSVVGRSESNRQPGGAERDLPARVMAPPFP